MEVSVWRRVSLSRSLRRFLLIGVPAVTLLGLVGVATWRFFARGTQRRRSIFSPSPERATASKLVEGQASPAGSEDSGVADAGSQEGGSRKPSQETILSAHRLTSRLTYHSGIKEFVPQHQVHLEPATRKPSAPRQEQDTEAPLKGEGGHHGGPSVNSKGWPYPTASSDLQSETFSELDSLSSSEGLLSMPPRSPVQIESSAVPSPTTSGPALHLSKQIPSSDSTLYFEHPASSSAEGGGVAASKSMPGVIKQDRIRVILQLPKDLVGRFIGKQGRNIKALMADSNGAHVYVNQKNLPKEALIVPCTVQGTADQVELALQIIDSKYPEIDVPVRGGGAYGKATTSSRPQQSPMYGSSIQLESPLFNSALQLEEESWDNEVEPAMVPSSPFKAMVSYIETLDRVWLVPQRQSAQLDDQHQSMSYTYCYAAVVKGDGLSAKDDDKALIGKCCAVRVSDIHWLRGKVSQRNDDGVNFQVHLMDYGSTAVVPPSAIRPLRWVSTRGVSACMILNVTHV